MHYTKKIVSSLVVSSLVFMQIPFAQANETLTQDEVNQVEKSIVDLQLHIFDNGKNLMETLMTDFKKKSSFEESGSGKATLGVNYYGQKMDATLSISDYKMKQSMIDFDASGKFKFDAKVRGSIDDTIESESVEGKFANIESLFSAIQKDGNLYGLLQNFSGTTNDESFQEDLDEVKKMFSENKYIKYANLTDEERKQIEQMLLALSPAGVLDSTESVMKKSLLTPYKKEGNKYFLIPTRHACETIFSLDGLINSYTSSWYEPTECTDSVYKSMVNEVKNMGQFYITLGDSNTLVLDESNSSENLKMMIGYNKDTIGMFQVDVSEKKSTKNFFKVNYIKNRNLNVALKSEVEKMDFSFTSKLKNNSFDTITSSISIPKVMKGNFALKNKKFGGKYYFYENGYEYDYNTEEYEEKVVSTYFLQTSGKQNKDLDLETMNIDFVGVDNETKDKIATAKINYNKNNLKFAFQANSDYETYEWMGEGKVFAESIDIKSQFASKEYLNDRLTTQMSGNLNLMYDIASPNNNISLFVDLNQSQENIGSLKIDYTGKKEFKENILIEAPKNVSDIDLFAEDDEEIITEEVEIPYQVDYEVENSEELKITIIGDKRCLDCITNQEYYDEIKGISSLKNAKIEMMDFSDKGSDEILKSAGITKLPVIILSTNKINTSEINSLFPTNDNRYYIDIDSSFDPYITYSDRGFKLIDKKTLLSVTQGLNFSLSKDTEILWLQYSDLGCASCISFMKSGITESVLLSYSNKVSKTIVGYVTAGGLESENAIESITCMADQNPKLYNTAWNYFFETGDYSKEALLKFAKNKKINIEKYESCLTNRDNYSKQYNQELDASNYFGVNSTPSNILINIKTGEYINANWSIEENIEKLLTK